MGTLIIILVVAILAACAAVALSRRRSPARLSEEDGDPRRPWDDVVERPAGADAEATGVDEPGVGTTTPPVARSRRRDPDVRPEP
ncbi:MAG TPA: hypothetical protein VK306_07875 [Acidimicrobiales bacterium]|nr:hypothetical protein [Acidimicrobiales bacterium]